MSDDPAIRARIEKVYMIPLRPSATETRAQLEADLSIRAKIVRDAGIKPE